MLESKFQHDFITEVKKIFGDSVMVLKNDPNYIQGIPDFTILCGCKAALLEFKRTKDARHQPNQDYYINKANQNGGYATFVYPENKQQVLSDLYKYFTEQEGENNLCSNGTIIKN